MRLNKDNCDTTYLTYNIYGYIPYLDFNWIQFQLSTVFNIGIITGKVSLAGATRISL